MLVKGLFQYEARVYGYQMTVSFKSGLFDLRHKGAIHISETFRAIPLCQLRQVITNQITFKFKNAVSVDATLYEHFRFFKVLIYHLDFRESF